MVKSEKEIDEALGRVDTAKNNYPGMTYENGVEEALQWALGEISDEEFEFGKKEWR